MNWSCSVQHQCSFFVTQYSSAQEPTGELRRLIWRSHYCNSWRTSHATRNTLVGRHWPRVDLINDWKTRRARSSINHQASINWLTVVMTTRRPVAASAAGQVYTSELVALPLVDWYYATVARRGTAARFFKFNEAGFFLTISRFESMLVLLFVWKKVLQILCFML